MKSGKHVRLNSVENISLSYGSVNTRELKSVYLRMQCWVCPKSEEKNWEHIISKIRREIRLFAFGNIDHQQFRENYIVDLDLRSSGIISGKRSFLSCEVTLYPKTQTDIKSPEFSSRMEQFLRQLISSTPTLFKEFEVYERKR
jgi:hypothetical protein